MIRVHSRQGFKETDLTGTYVISIGGSHKYIDLDVMREKYDSCEKYLTLCVDDISVLTKGRESANLTRFCVSHLEEIREFLSDRTDQDIVIHCDAGLSRSTAVGSALGEILHLNVEYERDCKDKFRLGWIYRTIRRYWDSAN